LPTTIAIEETPLGIHPLPNQRGATPYHDCNPVAVGQYHAPSAIGEQSRDCKTSSIQWKDRKDKHIC